MSLSRGTSLFCLLNKGQEICVCLSFLSYESVVFPAASKVRGGGKGGGSCYVRARLCETGNAGSQFLESPETGADKKGAERGTQRKQTSAVFRLEHNIPVYREK